MELVELRKKLLRQGLESYDIDFFMQLYGLSHQLFEGQEIGELCSHNIWGINHDDELPPTEFTGLSFYDENYKELFDLYLDKVHFRTRCYLQDGTGYAVFVGFDTSYLNTEEGVKAEIKPKFAEVRYYSPEKPMSHNEIVKPTKKRWIRAKEDKPIIIEDFFDLDKLQGFFPKKESEGLARLKTLFGKKKAKTSE